MNFTKERYGATTVNALTKKYVTHSILGTDGHFLHICHGWKQILTEAE